MLLSGIFGNETAEKVLLFLENYEFGYPRGIAKTFDLSISQVQNQLERFEREGIVASRLVGKTRMYEWNPRYLFLPELRAMLEKALKRLPESLQEKYFRARTRPRRKGKPLP
ncbi:MAG TPA: ArsR family transcriptional regulator [Oligoflexia bacterium]|nr:ArsR family transcriptional regulator [Oligoflexia bacterium]